MKLRDILLAILVTLCWGFNFVAIKLGLDSFPPILFSSLRFACAALPAIFLFNRSGLEWRWILSIGFTLGVGMFTLLFIGIHLGMPAGLSSVVLQVQVIFTLLLSGIFLKDRPTIWQNIGISIAFLGIISLIVDRYDSAGFLGMLFVLGSGLSWAISNILMKISGNIDMLRLMIWMSLVPPIPLALLSLALEDGQIYAITHISLTGWGALFYTAMISSIFAYSLWGKLFQKYSANLIAPFALLVPVFGTLFSFLVLGENLSVIEMVACAVVLFGLVFMIYGKQLTHFIKGRSCLQNKGVRGISVRR